MYLLNGTDVTNQYNIVFSSPLFGDMFLLIMSKETEKQMKGVFVSYIRRYVLTNDDWRKVHCNIKVFVSYIWRYVLTSGYKDMNEPFDKVFVSYIRRYVLT